MSVSHATKTWWWPHFCDPEMWYFLARGNMLWRVKSTLTMAIALSKLSQSCAFAFAFAEMSVLHCSSCFKATSPCCHRASPFYIISRAKYHFSPVLIHVFFDVLFFLVHTLRSCHLKFWEMSPSPRLQLGVHMYFEDGLTLLTFFTKLATFKNAFYTYISKNNYDVGFTI